MQNIRIVEIPKMKAAFSGPMTDVEKVEKFRLWFTDLQETLECELYPRDFMWCNERTLINEWFYALPEGYDTSSLEFEVVNLPHGLYAVAPCLSPTVDASDDWLKTRWELIEWVYASDTFKLYDNRPGRPERYPMFHVVSPERLIDKGVCIADLYVPIEEKRR